MALVRDLTAFGALIAFACMLAVVTDAMTQRSAGPPSTAQTGTRLADAGGGAG